jgi:hypothetical protein
MPGVWGHSPFLSKWGRTSLVKERATAARDVVDTHHWLGRGRTSLVEERATAARAGASSFFAGPFDRWTIARSKPAASHEDVCCSWMRRQLRVRWSQRAASCPSARQPGPLSRPCTGTGRSHFRRRSAAPFPGEMGVPPTALRREDPSPVRLFSDQSSGERGRGSMTSAPQRAYTHRRFESGPGKPRRWARSRSLRHPDSSHSSHSPTHKSLREWRRVYDSRWSINRRARRKANELLCVCARWGTAALPHRLRFHAHSHGGYHVPHAS